MKKRIFTLTATSILLLSVAASHAQAPPGSQPAPSNARYAEYPAISPDDRVTFQLSAPLAQKVQVIPGEDEKGNGLGKGPFDMVKDNKGVWWVTVGPVTPGFHYYKFLVDGALVADPATQNYFAFDGGASGVEVPAAGLDFYLPKNVPHGDVRIHWFYSKVTETWLRVHIYLPPGYDSNTKTRYPVVYLRHEGSEDDSAWVFQGKLNFIMDNLIAEKKAKPMIVVMDNDHVYNPKEPKIKNERPNKPMAPPNRYKEEMITDLVPMIDATYRTIADRNHRAIAGMANGGGEALLIAFDPKDDLFSYAGAFSCGYCTTAVQGPATVTTIFDGIWKDPATFNKNFHLFYLSAGTLEMHHKFIPELHDKLTAIGVKSVYHEVGGAGGTHEWLNAREAFRDFAPRLCQ